MGFNKGIRLLALAMALACLPWSAALATAEVPAVGTLENTEQNGAGEGEPSLPPETPGEATPTPAPVETPGPATPSPAPTATSAPSSAPSPAPSLTPSPLPTATALPPASPSPTPPATPTPPLSPTPTPVPTPTPLPTPTPTPAYGVTLQGGDARVQLGQSLDLASGVTAQDEKGTALKVTVVDDGGFDPRAVGSYTIHYQAIHPVTGKVYTLTRTVTVYKSAEQEKCKVTIVAGELVLQVGDSSYDLLKNAKALDETGQAVEVGVYSRAGFTTSSPGTYTVILGALHPETGELFKQGRTVRVLSEADYKAWQKAQRRLSGDSNSRYAKYLQYRNEIYEKLQAQMEGLCADMAQRIRMLGSVFEDKALQLVRYTPTLLDDSGGAGGAAMVPGAGAPEIETLSRFPVDAQGYTVLSDLSISNWSDILAVFVAGSSLDVEEPLDLMNLRKIEYDGLGQVFWDMNELTYHVDGETLRIMIIPASAQEMAGRYGWSEERQLSLEELLQPEFLKVFASLTGDTSFDDMSPQEEAAIRATLPEGLDVQREAIVMTACSLVDKVSYFWGGKYNEVGWNPLWGIPKRVASEGSVTTGKVRNFGLDCSGFVAWAFINAAGDPAVAQAIGEGSANQWSKSKSLGWDEGQPGDLAFLAKPGSVDINHVGIVAYKTEDGQYMIVHSSSRANGVVVTEALSSGFRYLRRPALYADGEEAGQ